MNAEADAAATKKRPPISLPFLAVVVVLGVVGYLAGPWIMTRVMLMQEAAKANAPAIGHETPPGRPQLGGGGGGGSAGEERTPASIFAERDADSNGKLEGDEISERMQGRLADIDTDGDGAVTEEEFSAAMQSRGERPAGEGSGSDAEPAVEGEEGPGN